MSEFLKISSLHDLAIFFNMPVNGLWKICSNKNNNYRNFSIKKKDGSDREINAPLKDLRWIQFRIAKAMLEIYRPRSHVYSFCKNKSYDQGADVHTNRRWVLRVDIKNFFSSIEKKRVYGMFLRHPFLFTKPVAMMLADLSTYNDCLPQGSPSSPVISNFICRRLDNKLSNLRKSSGIRVSRYADDFVFSTNANSFVDTFVKRTAEGVQVGEIFQKIFDDEGFRINPEKTNLMNKARRQIVNGLVVNKKVNIRREYYLNLKSNVHDLCALNFPKLAQVFKEKDRKYRGQSLDDKKITQIILGRVSFLGRIRGWDDDRYIKMAIKINRTQNFPILPINYTPKTKADVYFFVEGPTDFTYLISAHKHFTEKENFTRFSLICNHSPGGSSVLKTKIKEIKSGQYKPDHLTIFLFDRDEKEIIKEFGTYGEEGSIEGRIDVKSWVIMIPSPKDGSLVSIEELFSERDRHEILLDGDKRIFLKSEFQQNGVHKIKNTKYLNMNNEGSNRVTESVFDTETKDFCSLNKVRFSKLVESKYRELDFTKFEPIFQAIERIITKSYLG